MDNSLNVYYQQANLLKNEPCNTAFKAAGAAAFLYLVICKTGALLLLFIDSCIFFSHLGIKCFNSTIFGEKTSDCCLIQVEQWLVQLNAPPDDHQCL